MAINLPQQAMQGAIAFRQAVEDAGNAVDQTMLQYGWQMPTGTGGYSSFAAADAFDPNNVLTFDDKGKTIQTTPTLGVGQYGTTGLFARSAQETAAEEAQSRAATRASGITGGLARQREQLSETLGAERMGGLSAGLLAAIQQQYGDVESAYGRALEGSISDETTMAGITSEVMPISSTTTPVAPAPAATTEAVTPTVKDIRTKPKGSSLNETEFDVLLNNNKSVGIDALKNMLAGRWKLTPNQEALIRKSIVDIARGQGG